MCPYPYRFRMIRLREKEVPEFKNKVIPPLDKEVPDEIFAVSTLVFGIRIFSAFFYCNTFYISHILKLANQNKNVCIFRRR